jgi:hypothetical protein
MTEKPQATITPTYRRISGLLQIWIAGIVIAQSEILILQELFNLTWVSGLFLIGYFSLSFGGGLVGLLGMIDLIRWWRHSVNGKIPSTIRNRILGILALGFGFVGLEGYVSAVVGGLTLIPIISIVAPIISLFSSALISFGVLRTIQSFLL